ncbi:MAG: hypothetical protein GF341_12925 [candidate division Zixibacteria bacterium]|nr:hypothetical protein [candidate division Zixibacteria bacterium]
MRTILITVFALAAFLALGCGDTENLETQLTATENRAAELDSMLTETQAELTDATDRAEDFKQSLAEVHDEREALKTSLDNANAEVADLKIDLRGARDMRRYMVDSLKAVVASVDADRRTCYTELTSAESRIKASERRINELTNTRDSLFAFMDDVEPWYAHYKHEAQRNWLKKLFSAGDMEQPDVPEPSFDADTPPADLEAARP